MTISTKIDGKRVEVDVSVAEILYAASKIEDALYEQTKNITVLCANAYAWRDGDTLPTIGIRKADKVGALESLCGVGDMNWMIAGTLYRKDNGQEIVRIADLMRYGYENAYVELCAQAAARGYLSRFRLGKRKIVNMSVRGEIVYLTLAPLE
jgi:hypothetical protein